MKKKTIVLAALAAVLAATMCINSALAYFTTYTAAKVRGRVSLDTETTIEEKVEDWEKTISVSNSADADASVYIRVAAYGPSEYPLNFTLGDGWSFGGEIGNGTKGILGYFYYKDPVKPGESTPDLKIQITGVPSDSGGMEETLLPNLPEDGESFDVTVIYEKTAVIYEDGNPMENDKGHASEIWGKKVEGGGV